MFLKKCFQLIVILSGLAGVSNPAAFATGIPKTELLTPENIAELGFDIVVLNDGGATTVKLIGPEISPLGCPPKRMGAWLFDEQGNELLGYLAELKNYSTKPEAIGYYLDKNHRMSVVIQYLCQDADVLNSRVYTVESISEFLLEE